MKLHSLFSLLILATAFCFFPAIVNAADFYAHYTRLDQSDTPARQLMGKYADVVVNLQSGRFIFNRKFSYLPYWKVGDSQWLVDEIIKRKGNGPSERPDNINKCSYVRIIEISPEKIVIHLRYARNINGSRFTNFEDAYDGSMAKYFRDYVNEYFGPYLEAIISGLVGVHPVASEHKVEIYPQLPKDLSYFSLHDVQFDGHKLDVDWKREGEKNMLTFSHTKGSTNLQVVFRFAREERSRMKVNGKTINPEKEELSGMMTGRVTISLPPGNSVTVLLETRK